VSAAASPLRRVLAEVRAAADAPTTLDGIATRVGVTRAEVESMIDYWARRGRLSVDQIGRGCPGSGCDACPSARSGAPACGSPATGGPVLLAISPTRPAA
jgi:hypothetical protein